MEQISSKISELKTSLIWDEKDKNITLKFGDEG